MPALADKWDWELVKLFLSEYEGGAWAEGLAIYDRPETVADGGVEVVATRRSDGLRLAIEHTLIEPFVGDKNDFHGPFKWFQARLRGNASLQVRGFSLRLYLPVGSLPPGTRWEPVADEVAAWLQAEHRSLPSEIGRRVCPCPSYTGGEVEVWVASVPLGDTARSFPIIVGRRVPEGLDDSVDKALARKLPKLVSASADRRVLLLERDQGVVVGEAIRAKVRLRREDYPGLAKVDEVWIADTATWERRGSWVSFSHDPGLGRRMDQFEFYNGELWSSGHPRMPRPDALR